MGPARAEVHDRTPRSTREANCFGGKHLKTKVDKAASAELDLWRRKKPTQRRKAEDTMTRSNASNTKAPEPVAQTAPAPTLSIAQIKAQRDALNAQIKAARAATKGQVAMQLAEDGVTWQVDVKPGPMAQSGDGRVYLFTADGIEFTHNGVTYQTGPFYALPKKAGK